MSEHGGRGTIARTPRPRNRRAQIITAASELFYRFGYHNVGTEDIAGAVGITAGALYRHFRSKEELLVCALTDSFDLAASVVDRHHDGQLTAMVQDLAETAGRRRDLGVLWSRESRHLNDEQRQRMRERFFAFLAGFVVALNDVRDGLSRDDAELLAWCALAVLTSPSYHGVPAAPETMVALLRRMALSVCTVDIAGVSGQPAPEPVTTEAGLSPQGRREALLVAAARLFSIRGYQTVTMEEVGAEVGVTSAGVYRHFTTKADLLMAIVARAAESLQLGIARALAAATTPQAGLENVVAAYIDFAMAHTDLVNVLVAEVMNLPYWNRHRIRKAQHDYVAEWVSLMAATRPDLDRTAALFRIHAVLMVVNDVARTAHLRSQPKVTEKLRLVAAHILHS
ncbi:MULTISPECIES: TetR/AcrR family transcriptional regulator [Protofrankia]|uniref:Regulatory protein TetR n=1 Tax=Candidatus Protofrankia datiscae TaxID=2716812 RepID=F8AY59_9ACTN|nr:MULTISPECIES: TetR/AcrR family transcriptional regulator [Protofrankia]AEH09489.1 regulatory protein TetR [Candidatus Protofrankia datiscae]